MSAIQIILFKQAGKIHYQGDIFTVASNQLVVTTEAATASGPIRDGWMSVFCYPGELHGLYHEVIDLIGPSVDAQHFQLEAAKVLPVFDELSNVIEQLNGNRSLLIKFIFTYCLGMDNPYFSGLMRYFLAHNDRMLSYLEGHFMRPWPVTRFAEDLGIEVRKLNFLFYKNYGVSAKQWLLERRLTYARQQLIVTEKKVVDIALDSGFSNHAHFTESFKRRYQCSPTMLRSTLV
jgi:AraC-like DNA-binding protein